MSLDLTGAVTQLRGMLEGLIERTPYIVVALLVFGVFIVLGHGVRTGITRALQGRSHAHNLGLVLGRLCHGLVVFLGLMIALVIALPSFQPAQLFQVLGIGSVAIGFAFRDILQNFLAGILLLLTEPFRIGDQIAVGNYEGTVEDIQTRATYIKTYDGRRVVIPNSNLFTNSVTVNTAYAIRRYEYDIGIGYGADIATAKRVMLETVRALPDVLDDPVPDALVVELAPSTVNIRLRWWITPPRKADVLAVRSHVLESVKQALTQAGIDLPYPTQQVFWLNRPRNGGSEAQPAEITGGPNHAVGTNGRESR